MTKDEIYSSLVKVITNRVDDIPFTKDTRLDEFGFDSLEMVELIMDVEKEFNVAIQDDQVLDTVNDILEFIYRA